MEQQELIPHLFRTEYRKIVSVLCKLFGIGHIETAEDIVSDTFLQAAETWGLKDLPKNPTAWLYAVSKNKAIDFLRRDKTFSQKISPEIKQNGSSEPEPEINWSVKNFSDSQLQMMFAVCHPCIPAESQIGLSLSILCGFGVEEIADAFLSNRETIYKRIARAKEKLRTEKIKIEIPPSSEINNRLENVLTTLYLLFSEGYYSTSQNTTLRKDLCVEAMRLCLMLTEHEQTDTPAANALLSLMCFHSSRFEARMEQNGEIILYEDQDDNLWNQELIGRGEAYLNKASQGTKLSKYHIEAAIAYWHTHKADTKEKWENILQLYNRLLQLEYSPTAALNRTYALSKANSKEEAIIEAEKLQLTTDHLYHSLLANLYESVDPQKVKTHLNTALQLAKTDTDKKIIEKKLREMV
ncbi:MAG: polymerase subunit sigma [Bacteroidetes bacterium]|jgi:RNA polymerase sigma-70 factor (ECF subfamily)|nr:polymerase subunit sigma [Bacteroidota bacterium]